MKSTWKMNWTAIAITAIAISPVLLSSPVTAQNITAAPDGTGTVILPNGQRFDITGGTQAGANLFHSFQQFGLNQGQIANFLSQPNIQNILGRVVGGDPSVINGLIQLTGGNSNLYIMNPAGIIFGANASLNVPAAFTATTANGIQVGNAWFGMNTSASDLKNLTGSPNAFAFTTPTTTTQASGVILNQGNLSVPSGNSITLVGGIVINTGTISTPNGKINIVAVPDGKYVRITPEGSALSLDLPIATQQELGNAKPMTVVNLPSLLTGTGIAAPTQSGTALISGNLTANSIDILANRYDTSQANLNAATIQQGWNFVFIDSTIKNYQTLLDGTKGGSSITVINPDQYGIAEVTKTLASVTGANSLHIVSEGDVGNFWLGKDFVSGENIAKYANDLQAWKTALSPAANILLYACNLASGENGVALVQAVKNYTGHDVAASINRTGATSLGGDWTLEYRTGQNSVPIIFNNAATQAYQNALAVFTVTNAADLGAGSLRAQIAAANLALGADEIRFSFSGIPIVLTSGEISITQALLISGNGITNTIIDGNANSRIFNVTFAVPVTIDGVTIRNGNIAGNGGGIVSNGGSITLNSSNVSGNRATNGGGVFTTGAVALTNSTVSSNTASNIAGGIWGDGGVTLNNSAVSNNIANANNGGILSNIGAITLNNSTVSGNTAVNGDTGGIFSPAAVTLNNSSVLNNRARTSGGGIFSFGTVTLTNSTVSNNTATTGVGGGIVTIGAMTITNSIVSGNTAGNDGGGIYSIGAVTLTNSTVSGNSANVNSGGIYANNGGTIVNSTISGNTANFGGGIIVNGGAMTLTNSNILGNRANNNDGGGIANFGTTTLTNVAVQNNTAGDDGGGIVNFGTLNIFNSTLSNNTALSASSANSGGGALLNTIGGTATLTNTTVSGNTAKNGGGIRNDGNLTLTNTTVTNNLATGGFGGGGIANSVGVLTIRNTILAGNIDTSGNNIVDLGKSPFATVTDAGNNLIGNTANTGTPITFAASTLLNVDPKLAPLANYGGVTQTHALLPNSPALNAGNNAFATATDQRGAPRIIGSAVDIGAFESQGFSLTPLANTTPQSTNINTSFAQILGIQVTENFVNSPIPAPNILVSFTPSSSAANGFFAGNTSVLTNNLGIAVAPIFTANGVSGSYSVAATANGFTPANFSLTNKSTGGFGGVFPSREDLEGRSPRLDEQDLEDVSFTQVLCLDASLNNAKITSIPPCKKP